MDNIVIIPAGMRIVSEEEVEALESKIPKYPASHAGMSFDSLPKPGCACIACNMASLQRYEEQRDEDFEIERRRKATAHLPDNGMTAYMLGHSDMPSMADVELGYVTLDDFEHITLESMPAFLRPQAGEPRKRVSSSAYLNPHCLNDGKPCNPNGDGGCVSCERVFSAVIDYAQYTLEEGELLALYLNFGVLDFDLNQLPEEI